MKSFEDKFMDIQISLVSLAMEYIEGHADKIFLYCINEKEMIEFNVFYKLGTNYSLIHEVNNQLDDEKKSIHHAKCRFHCLKMESKIC